MPRIYSFVTRLSGAVALWWMIGAMALSGCELSPNGLSSPSTIDESAVPSQDPTMITVTGEITEVMESWPLQLVVMGEADQYDVALESDTSIYRGSEVIPAGQLSPGFQVRIQGVMGSPGSGIVAKTIEVL